MFPAKGKTNKTMKIYTKIIKPLIFGSVLSLSLSSCFTSDYYEPTPDPTPIGYQKIFNDEFNRDNYGWGFNDYYSDAYGEVYNGMYSLSYYGPSGNSYSSTIPVNFNSNRDFLIQTGISSNYAMALNFGASSKDYGYSFFIDADGYFAVYDEGTANIAPRTLIDWKASNAIDYDWNDIEIEQIGNRWYGYINGMQVFELPAYQLYGSDVGFLILGGTEGYADYLTVKW